jgi:adenylate cyclase
MKMSSRDRRGWKIFLWLTLGALVISGYFGYSVAPEDVSPLRGLAIGLLSALFIATPIFLFELRWQRLRMVRRMRRLPLPIYLGLRVVLYVVIILVGLSAARLVLDGSEFRFTDIFAGGGFTFSVAMAVFANIALEMGNLLGFRTIGKLVTGRYVRPRRELKAFLLIDMKNSTGIAEQLGPIRFHELLNDFFRDIAAAALESGAEIHKYVGDEAILTWPADRIPLDGDVVACPFAVRDFIAGNDKRYRRQFGIVPGFRAALHVGEIVAGQIGDIRREIAYVGDTLNVAARLLEAAKEVGHDILVSTDLLEKATLPPGIVAKPLQTLAVRGRAAPIGIAALSRE